MFCHIFYYLCNWSSDFTILSTVVQKRFKALAAHKAEDSHAFNFSQLWFWAECSAHFAVHGSTVTKVGERVITMLSVFIANRETLQSTLSHTLVFSKFQQMLNFPKIISNVYSQTANCKLNRRTAIVINTLSLLKLFVNGMTCPPMLLR